MKGGRREEEKRGKRGRREYRWKVPLHLRLSEVPDRIIVVGKKST
jgi:hypothetical protein